jgi:DNA-binding transcriptional MerR regulator
MAGVSPKTLRHYERLRPIAPRRNAAGYRVYTEGELHRVHDVLALKALGLSLSEVRDLLANRRAPLDVLRAQRETLERKRRSVDRALDVIREVERFEAARPAADRALPTLIAEASWSRAEQQRAEAAPPGGRAPDRAGA